MACALGAQAAGMQTKGVLGLKPRRAVLCKGRLAALPRQASLITCQAARDVKSSAAAATAEELLTAEQAVQLGVAATDVEAPEFTRKSYSQEYDDIFAKPLNTKKIVPKPSRLAQQAEPGAGSIFLSNVPTVKKHAWFLDREWDAVDRGYGLFMLGVHGVALLAPFTFSWPMFFLFMGTYFVTGCLGITCGYHRLLAHRSFKCPKWVEHILAYCGVLAVQGSPQEWASTHRYHHLHCDTPLDPHSPYEGFWWCHMGWILDHKTTLTRVGDRSNVRDIMQDPWYQHFEKHYIWHVVGMYVALFALGGLPALVWGGALRTIWVYHITWFVNSATHCWGYQDYNTGDLSKNNWWVGILAWGEGWHNNHHAFEFSARHGLEDWQIDVTWGVIKTLEKWGLAWDIKLPTPTQKARLAFPDGKKHLDTPY
ncbi:hypothetical protein N2152v2_007779 [Parachlorella kessleri]